MLGKDENGGESPSVVVFCKDLGGPFIYLSKKSTNPLNKTQILFFLNYFDNFIYSEVV